MPATCAICLVPIGKGEKFALVETEVVHRRCIASPTARQTILTRARLTAVEAERQREAYRIALQSERAHGENLARARAAEATELANLRYALDRMRDERDSVKTRLDLARRERDEAMAARDAARREAALHQTIQAARADPAPAPEIPVVAKDDRDAAEIRFSLLELDEP